MPGWKDRLLFWRTREEERAAYDEVLALIRRHPVEGYGLYHLLNDAGLLNASAQQDLAPLVAQIEQRFDLGDDEPQVALPLLFDPITDAEHDTLTALIGEALRRFMRELPHMDEDERLHALLETIDLLERHRHQTAALDVEVGLQEVLDLILKRCAHSLKFVRKGGGIAAQPGDFFRVSKAGQARQKFTSAFLTERAMEEGEIVQVAEVWQKGYVSVHLLGRTIPYSRSWFIERARKAHPKYETASTVIHQAEGRLYRLEKKYAGAVRRFVNLYHEHLHDRSVDPAIYQPAGKSKA